MFKLDLEKAEEPEVKLATSVGSSKKQESSRKKSTSALLTMPKPLTVGIKKKIGKFSRDGNTRPLYLPPEKSVHRSRNNGHGTMDWFQIVKGADQDCAFLGSKITADGDSSHEIKSH